MKSPLNKLPIILLLLVSPLLAQEGEKNGFINVVNLIPETSGCTVFIHSHDLAPGGLKSGNDSGWFSMENRNITIEIKAEGFEEANGSVELTPGTSQVVAIFVQQNPRKGTEVDPALPVIKIKRFPSFTGSGSHPLKLASTCPSENRFVVAGKSVNLKQFSPYEIQGWNGAGFGIERNGGKNRCSARRLRQRLLLRPNRNQ